MDGLRCLRTSLLNNISCHYSLAASVTGKLNETHIHSPAFLLSQALAEESLQAKQAGPRFCN